MATGSVGFVVSRHAVFHDLHTPFFFKSSARDWDWIERFFEILHRRHARVETISGNTPSKLLSINVDAAKLWAGWRSAVAVEREVTLTHDTIAAQMHPRQETHRSFEMHPRHCCSDRRTATDYRRTAVAASGSAIQSTLFRRCLLWYFAVIAVLGCFLFETETNQRRTGSLIHHGPPLSVCWRRGAEWHHAEEICTNETSLEKPNVP